VIVVVATMVVVTMVKGHEYRVRVMKELMVRVTMKWRLRVMKCKVRLN